MSANDSSVLFLTGTLEVGGSEQKVVKLANAFASGGFDVGIAYLNKPDPLRNCIDRTVLVSYLNRNGKYSIPSLRRLLDLVGQRFSAIVSVNFYPLLYAVPAAKLFLRGGTRVISLVNTTEFVDGDWILGPIYAPFIRRCNSIVFGCEAQKSMWIEKYRIPAVRSHCIYNGVDAAHFSITAMEHSAASFRGKLSIPVGALVVGSIGRLAPEKHFELLIDAVSNLVRVGKNVYLVLVGSGEQRHEFERAALRCGIQGRIRFAGVMEDVRPAIAAMDVFVLPSRAVETFSNAALEAMSMKRPVVLSRVGGAAEMVDDRVSGLLFDAGDIGKLTALLTQLHDSKQYRMALGEAARTTIINRFSFTTMVKAYKKVIFS